MHLLPWRQLEAHVHLTDVEVELPVRKENATLMTPRSIKLSLSLAPRAVVAFDVAPRPVLRALAWPLDRGPDWRRWVVRSVVDARRLEVDDDWIRCLHSFPRSSTRSASARSLLILE